MSITYQEVLKISLLGCIGALVYKQIKSMLKLSNKVKKIKISQIKSINELNHHLAKQKKQNCQVLLKLQPYYFQPIQSEIKIRSINKYYAQPLDQQVILKIKKILQDDWNQAKKSKKNNYFWYAKQSFQQKSYLKIDGFGKIVGDFFQIKRQYEPKKKLGYWNRFRDWITRHFINKNEVGTTKTHRFMLGPIVGILTYHVNLMLDCQIVAMCKFQDGHIIPTVTAVSKNQIIQYYQNQLQTKYAFVAIGITFLIVLGRWLWADIKRFFNILKIKREKMNRAYFNPKQLISDDKLCIICYNNCRNLIFFDCRHIIMCQECCQTYKSETCPYCKMEIQQMKIIVNYN